DHRGGRLSLAGDDRGRATAGVGKQQLRAARRWHRADRSTKARTGVSGVIMRTVITRAPIIAAVALAASIVFVAPASAMTATGTAWAWGANGYGELGNNATINKTTPTAVANLPGGVVSVSAAARHSFAILADGSVKAWGRNASGELGTGNTTEQHVP